MSVRIVRQEREHISSQQLPLSRCTPYRHPRYPPPPRRAKQLSSFKGAPAHVLPTQSRAMLGRIASIALRLVALDPHGIPIGMYATRDGRSGEARDGILRGLRVVRGEGAVGVEMLTLKPG